jgi:hypothetical protein
MIVRNALLAVWAQECTDDVESITKAVGDSPDQE